MKIHSPLRRAQGIHLLEVLCVLMLMSSLAYLALPNSHVVKEGLGMRQLHERVIHFLQTELLKASQAEKVLTIELKRNSLHSRQPGAISLSLTLPDKAYLASKLTALKAYPRGVVSPATLRLHYGRRACKITISLRARIRSSCG